MYNIMDEKEFIRNFKVFSQGDIDFFLGAGASVSSGISTGGDMIWFFKREIYCTENDMTQDRFKDLKSETNRKILQDYFDSQGGYPTYGSPDEYSFYFEKCFSSCEARKCFIDSQVVRKSPAIGYLCLANLVVNSKVKNIWTTNFDELSEIAIHQLDALFPLNVLSSINKDAFSRLNQTYSCVYKLHGDYRYDKLQNTSEELKELENDIQTQFYNKLQNKGLLVIGYSGSDESVMGFFEKHIMESDFLSKGLFWTTIKGHGVSPRVCRLIDELNGRGKRSAIIEIESFDAFLLNIYHAIGNRIDIVDKQAKYRERRKKLQFNLKRVSNFIKLNAFEATSCPICKVFETDIKNWATLRHYREQLVSALFNNHIYCFATDEQIKEKFDGHIKSEILDQDISQWMLNQSNSIYTGMLYDLIAKSLVERGFIQYRRTKFYDVSSAKKESKYIVYDAIEICLEVIGGKYYMNISPTYYITNLNGCEPDRFTYQKIIKSKSNQYNKQYNDILYGWQKKIILKGKMIFEYNGYSIEFKVPAASSGGINCAPQWTVFKAYYTQEPQMVFSYNNKMFNSINQLKGLLKYGPIDSSFMQNNISQSPIKLGIISPDRDIDMVLTHLDSLNMRHPNKGKDGFLPHYEGFSRIYKRVLQIPHKSDKSLCVMYNQEQVGALTAHKFVEFHKRCIDRFALNRADFDVLVIYIPNAYKKFRESESISADFDLHDALKLYATDKGVTVQFIEEKSIKSNDKCKVVWGLSTALYAKASMGVLWQPQMIAENTAYIGISYAISKNKGICIGCSQLFDSTGTGMRMILRKIDNPHFEGKQNPYMGQEEARSMMSALREEYYRCNPTAKLNRIVIHKTTPFMKEEILGFMQAFEGVGDIEMIQVQVSNPWKGIKFDADYKNGADSYPVDRGTIMQLDDSSFLLWTHGCIKHPDLGYGRYYKNGNGTPTPLVIKRFCGNSSGDVLANEIMMLTKMNWNSGDSLYKVLPVTLDFAKTLSRMSKQNEAIYNKAYDFRYFM